MLLRSSIQRCTYTDTSGLNNMIFYIATCSHEYLSGLHMIVPFLESIRDTQEGKWAHCDYYSVLRIVRPWYRLVPSVQGQPNQKLNEGSPFHKRHHLRKGSKPVIKVVCRIPITTLFEIRDGTHTEILTGKGQTGPPQACSRTSQATQTEVI
jgi:hypothetical protein